MMHGTHSSARAPVAVGAEESTAAGRPQFTHSLSSARAEALLARVRAAADSPTTAAPASGGATTHTVSSTMYTTLNGFIKSSGASSPIVTGAEDAVASPARVSAQLVEQVQVLVEQVSGEHLGPSHRARRIGLTQALLSDCASLGVTPSMVLAGIPTILEQFALAAIEEVPPTPRSRAVEVAVVPAPVPASTRDSLVDAERLLPPLVDHAQLMTSDGVDALAMDTYMAALATAEPARHTTGATRTVREAPSSPTTVTTASAMQPAYMRTDATAAEVLIALLELCAKPLTYLTLSDQQCLPAAVEALALSCSLIATRLDTSVLLANEPSTQGKGTDGNQAEEAAALRARVRVLREIRLAALATVESVLRPFAGASGGGSGDTVAADKTRSRTARAATGARQRRKDHSSNPLKSLRGLHTVTTTAPRGISSAAMSSAGIAQLAGTAAAPSSSVTAVVPPSAAVYEATVVAATLGAMDAEGFVSALCEPLLARWATILQRATVCSTAMAELADGGVGSAVRAASQPPFAESDDRRPQEMDEDAREVLVYSVVEQLRLDSAHQRPQASPEHDLMGTRPANTAHTATTAPSQRSGEMSAAVNQRSHADGRSDSNSSSDDDNDDDDVHATGRSRVPASGRSSTAAAHQRLVLSRHEEAEVMCLLRITGHLLVILEQQAVHDATWRKLLPPPSTTTTTATAETSADHHHRANDDSKIAVRLHPLLPVLLVRTLSRALPGDRCASIAMNLLGRLQRRAPRLVSRALLYHVEDATMVARFEQGRAVGIDDGDETNDGDEGKDDGGGGHHTHTASSVEDVTTVPEPCALESFFDACVVQLNASHRLQQRELRNDLLTIMITVLSDDASALREFGLARQNARSPSSLTPYGVAEVPQTALLPLPPRAVDAVNAIVLTMFNLLCSPELNLAGADGLNEASAGEGQTAAANTASSMLEMLGTQLPLLSAQTLVHYSVRFNGVASPSQRREFLQFKRLGWQLLASFCEWQAARVYFEGARYIPRALAATAATASVPHAAHRTTYDGLHLVDLSLLGFLDALLLYVDVDCRVAAVVAWTQEELVTLQSDAWQLMISLVENTEERRQLFAWEWETFTASLANAATAAPGSDETGAGTDAPLADECARSLRSGSMFSATTLALSGTGPIANRMPDDHTLATALKASSRFSAAPPPRRATLLCAADAEVETETALPAALATPSILKGPDVHLLEAGVVEVALRFVREAPVLVEPLKHKAIQLLAAIACSTSTTGATADAHDDFADVEAGGRRSTRGLSTVDGGGGQGLHLSLNARLTVQKYAPTLVRALVARTPGLVKLLVHILHELQQGHDAGSGGAVDMASVSSVASSSSPQVVVDALAEWSSPASPDTPFSISFLQSASSSLLALVCMHFLRCLGESAQEEVGGIHELDALHHHGARRRQSQESPQDHHTASRARRHRPGAGTDFATGELVTVVDMGYESESGDPRLAADNDDGGGNDGFADELSEEDKRFDANFARDDDNRDDVEVDGDARHVAEREHSLKPMASAPGGGGGGGDGGIGRLYRASTFRDVMKLGYEFEDAGGIELTVLWMRQVLLPNPAEARAVGMHMDLNGTATTNQSTLIGATGVGHGGLARAPPLQVSHLARQLDMLVALFGLTRGLILGSEHTEQSFVRAGGVGALLDVIEALAIASHALLPIPPQTTTTTHGTAPTTASQHTDPEASPAAVARLKAALSLAMIDDPTPLAAAARGDGRMLLSRQKAFTEALQYALTLLSELLYTNEMACQALLQWRSRRIEKCAMSTGGALPVRTSHDVFMNATQLLIKLWATAIARCPVRHDAAANGAAAATATSASASATAPVTSAAGLDVLRLDVRERARALLRDEYVRCFLRAKLTHLFPEEAADVLKASDEQGLSTDEFDLTAKKLALLTSYAAHEAHVAQSILEDVVRLLGRLDTAELLLYYLYVTGQAESIHDGRDETTAEGSPRGVDAEVRLCDLRSRVQAASRATAVAGDDNSNNDDVNSPARLVAVLTDRERERIVLDLASRVAVSDGGSEHNRHARIGALLHSALGWGAKVYSCLASLGFENLISHPGAGVRSSDNSSALDASGSPLGRTAHGGAETVSLSPSERSHLISIAALPALCMDELCVAMASVASVLDEASAVAFGGAARRAGAASPRGRRPGSLSGLSVPLPADAEASASTGAAAQVGADPAAAAAWAGARMRPTSPDRRCLQGVLTDVYARGHEIGQLVHLGYEASHTQDQQLYDRFLVTRLRQPVTVHRGNAQTLLAMRDATYSTAAESHSRGGRVRGSSQLYGRRHSATYGTEQPHVVVPLSPSTSPSSLKRGGADDGGMSALASRLAARMVQTQREREAQQLLQSLSGAPATAAAAAAVQSAVKGSSSASATGEMFMPGSGGHLARQLAMHSPTHARSGGGGGVGVTPLAASASSRRASQVSRGSAHPSRQHSTRSSATTTRAPQPPPPRAGTLVQQRRKKVEMVRHSLKRLPQQREEGTQDPSTQLVEAVLKGAQGNPSS